MKKMRRIKTDKNKVHNAGTTMVEVLVAFLVVMLMMGMFSRVVSASVHLLNRAQDIIHKTEAFDREYYKTTTVKTTEKTDLEIVLDEERTGSASNASMVIVELPGGEYRVYKDTDKETARYSFGTSDSGTKK